MNQIIVKLPLNVEKEFLMFRHVLSIMGVLLTLLSTQAFSVSPFKIRII